MRRSITIKGIENSLLSVSLTDILELVNDGSVYKWKILWLEGTGVIKEGNIIDFEKKINNSESGYFIEFPELFQLSRDLDQILEVLLIASADIECLRRYESDKVMVESCSICIELVDSSYWEISSDDELFINSLNSLPNKE